MNRFKLLLAAAVLVFSAVSAQPAKSDGCTLRGVCKPCISTHPQAQPCFFNPCTGQYICSSTACVDNCVPPV
jgi:hypothetical protein